MAHKPYKPSSSELAERRKYHIGHRLAWKAGETPTFEKKAVTTEACVVCKKIFHRPETICNRCGTCQFCGGLAQDRYSNTCYQCGNHIDQPRYDTLGSHIWVGGNIGTS
jgi:hypothetical protein